MQIKDSNCAVTGGTTGIGFAIAKALSARGAKVAICGRSQDRVEDAVGRLSGDEAIGFPCDVGNEESVLEFVRRTVDRFDRVDVVVNNAGLGYFAPIDELTVQQFDEIMRVNVRGTFLVTRAFLPPMLERGSGQIVNIASLAGRNGFVGGTAYSASKHAMLGLSRSLMLEVRKKGVRVITVLPGSVETPFFDKAGIEPDNLHRVLKPEDVAETVVRALELPDRALVSEIDIRPSNP